MTTTTTSLRHLEDAYIAAARRFARKLGRRWPGSDPARDRLMRELRQYADQPDATEYNAARAAFLDAQANR